MNARLSFIKNIEVPIEKFNSFDIIKNFDNLNANERKDASVYCANKITQCILLKEFYCKYLSDIIITTDYKNIEKTIIKLQEVNYVIGIEKIALTCILRKPLGINGSILEDDLIKDSFTKNSYKKIEEMESFILGNEIKCSCGRYLVYKNLKEYMKTTKQMKCSNCGKITEI